MILVGYSKYYVDNLAENIKRGQDRKVMSGLWPKLAPIGYLNDKTTRTIYVDPVKSPLIRKAFEAYATGNYTFARLHDSINALGLTGVKNRTLSISNYQYFLNNPFYYGIMRFAGERYAGKHEPLITKDLFDRCQAIMRRKSKSHTKQLKPYLYRGVFRCGECGGFMTIETQKGHNYLRCTKKLGSCTQRYVREEEISRQVSRYLQLMTVLPHESDEMVAELTHEQHEHQNAQRETIDSVRAKMQKLDERLGRLMNAYLDEAVTLDEFRPQKKILLDERRGLEDQIVALEKNRSSWLEPAIKFVKDWNQAGLTAEAGSEEEKRDFLKKVGSNLTIQDRHLSVIPRGAWKLVVDQASFAQHNTAPSLDGAVLAGETHQITTKRLVWDSLRAFFKDNPTWK
jgi:hypothetical protein